ncbi:hypothetical protein FisN_13Hu368 [Fistulifera solaris]|jgi:hypothetical protein|uniref:Uncharacterized protein n=1 Tax=Fistulifera solaris TaxID=1519565 RepID=A0A1Z5KMN8_FISSO|nr:hypothetical protein FisN_13Hu368 [Fistulifera solaris]|eukprot:GAX27546.1 hypothetical protein FisN_13Hu368 [Fistulifera solaris]
MQASFSSSHLYHDIHSSDLLPPSIPQRQVSSGEYNGCCDKNATLQASSSSREVGSPSIGKRNALSNQSSYFSKYTSSSSLHSSDSASMLTNTDPSNHSTSSEHSIFGKPMATRRSLLEEDDNENQCVVFMKDQFTTPRQNKPPALMDGHRWVHSSDILDPSSSSEWTMPLKPQRRTSLCSAMNK